jgi:immune inhibitor A
MINASLAINPNWKPPEPRIRRSRKQYHKSRNLSAVKDLIPLRMLVVFVIIAGLALSQSGALVQPTHAQTVSINIQNFAFNPQNITIETGSSVTWVNNDPVIYTLWFTNASDGSTYLLSQPINPGTSWTQAFTGQMRLNYYDFDRLYITGQLIVVPVLKGDFGPTLQIGTTTVPFAAAVSGGTTPYKFSWFFGDGTGSTNSTPTHTYQSFGTYNVTLTVTDSSTPNAFIVTASHLVSVSQTGGGGSRALEI